ncbi:MAG: hypothetical protein DWG78_01850 [Chloroflexi bacterium]|nr:hypothetical protein [Chloroflexota bacterium]
MTDADHPTETAPAEGDLAPRFLSLEEARALECNGCGDCCDSRRSDGYWTWGALPADQYRSLFDGQPLIIPLHRTDGGWADRPATTADEADLTPTRFRCGAFQPQPDGRGLCGIHDREVPPKCREFPVWGEQVEAELREFGRVWLATESFPRCTWYRVCVVQPVTPV